MTRSALAFLGLVVVACSGAVTPAPPSDGRRVIAIEVGASGYTPAEVTAAAGEPVRLVFTRTSDEGCGQQLVVPDANIHRDLPLNEAVPVDVTTPASGQLAFTCGMGMFRGAVVVR